MDNAHPRSQLSASIEELMRPHLVAARDKHRQFLLAEEEAQKEGLRREMRDAMLDAAKTLLHQPAFLQQFRLFESQRMNEEGMTFTEARSALLMQLVWQQMQAIDDYSTTQSEAEIMDTSTTSALPDAPVERELETNQGANEDSDPSDELGSEIDTGEAGDIRTMREQYLLQIDAVCAARSSELGRRLEGMAVRHELQQRLLQRQQATEMRQLRSEIDLRYVAELDRLQAAHERGEIASSTAPTAIDREQAETNFLLEDEIVTEIDIAEVLNNSDDVEDEETEWEHYSEYELVSEPEDELEEEVLQRIAQLNMENEEGEALNLRYSRSCGVCYAEAPRQRAVLTECGHVVCLACAERMRASTGHRESISCPFCRVRGGYVKLFEVEEEENNGPSYS